MIALLLAVSLSMPVVPAQVTPEPEPDPPETESELTVPSGPLPWALPVLPSYHVDYGTGTITFDEIQHTDDYADNLDDLNGRFADVTSVESDVTGEVSDWSAGNGILPDMSTADFDTGIDVPGYGDVTAVELATTLGANLGTMFARIRGLTELDLDLGGGVAVIALLVLAICWMILVEIIKFSLQIADMAWSVVTTIIELIPFAE